VPLSFSSFSLHDALPILNFLPHLFAAIIIIVIGVFVAKLVKQLFTQFFKTLNMDKWFNKVFPSNNEGDNAQETLSVVIANIIYRSEEHTSELQSRVDLVC